MQMLLVTFVATLAIAEIVASVTVKTVLTSVDRFLTAVTYEPSFEVVNGFLLFNFLADLFLDGFCDFSLVLFPKLNIFYFIFRSRSL